jgi:hypothetical protein
MSRHLCQVVSQCWMIDCYDELLCNLFPYESLVLCFNIQTLTVGRVHVRKRCHTQKWVMSTFSSTVNAARQAVETRRHHTRPTHTWSYIQSKHHQVQWIDLLKTCDISAPGESTDGQNTENEQVYMPSRREGQPAPYRRNETDHGTGTPDGFDPSSWTLDVHTLIGPGWGDKLEDLGGSTTLITFSCDGKKRNLLDVYKSVWTAGGDLWQTR